MKSEGESSLSGTLKQKHQSAVETHTAAASKENIHTHTHGQGKTSEVRTGGMESTYWHTQGLRKTNMNKRMEECFIVHKVVLKSL